MIYYVEVINLIIWCELRQAIRHFRADRLMQATMTDDSFSHEGGRLRAAWTSEMATRRANIVPSGWLRPGELT
jgi:predicted DNA-binding transcriptional regulator YafY